MPLLLVKGKGKSMSSCGLVLVNMFSPIISLKEEVQAVIIVHAFIEATSERSRRRDDFDNCNVINKTCRPSPLHGFLFIHSLAYFYYKTFDSSYNLKPKPLMAGNRN